MTSKKPNASSTPSTSAADAPAPPPPPRVFFAVTGFGPFAGVTENPTQKVVEGLRQRAAAEEAEETKDEGASSGGSPPVFSLSRSVVKTDVLRVSAADVERWVRVDLEEAARAVAEEVEGAEAAKAGAAKAGAEAAKATATTSATAATTADDAAAPPPPPPLRPYHFVAVHLGVYASATSPKVRLETRAHNSADFRVPDADGKVLLRQAITTTTRARARESERRRRWGERRGKGTPEDERAEWERRLESGLPLARVALRLSEEAAAGPPSSPPPPAWTVMTTDDAGRYLCNFIYWHSLCACREASAGEAKEGQKREEEEGKPLVSFLRRPLTTLFRRGRRRGQEEGRRRKARVVRHAVFVHLPPAEVLPVESQLEFVERLLQVLAEELSESCE